MIFNNSHRIINEIEKKRRKGQMIHFLSGDGCGDNYFYSILHGIKSLEDTLSLYYLVDNNSFDYFLHVVNAPNKIRVYKYNSDYKKLEKVNFDELFEKGKVTGILNIIDNNKDENVDKDTQSATDIAREQGNALTTQLSRISELLKVGKTRILLLLENMEWISNLYDKPDIIWISHLQSWKKSRNFMAVITIKNMELLKKYNFEEEDSFISTPSAIELKYAYMRYICRNTKESYDIDLMELDNVAHAMSIGRRSLVACMRVLRQILKENPNKLSLSNFADSIEKTIEEKVDWDEVRLDQITKSRIELAVNNFINSKGDGSARKGILLTGPPGTGKTMISKALANKAKCYFMAPTLAEFKGEYVGQTASKVRRLFAEARANSPTIMFIDEADTAFPSRNADNNDRDSFGLDMVNEFLQQIDGAKTGTQQIFIIAATNRPTMIDSAIRNRLSETPIEIPLPDKVLRAMIFDDNLLAQKGSFKLTGKTFADRVLDKSEGMSGRDISNFVKELKEGAKGADIQLQDDKITCQLFMSIFENREKYFISETIGEIISRDNIYTPEENNISFRDIIGYDDIKYRLGKQAEYIKADTVEKQKYAKFGVQPQKGVLLYGPPGNGKTAITQALAGEYGFYFFKVVSKDFETTSPAERVKIITQIFDTVKTFSKMMTDAKGIVLFFDEFDSLASERMDAATRGTLLTYLADKNGIRNRNSKILFVAATNFFDNIDEATKRKGRIDEHISVDNPSQKSGMEILRNFVHRDSKRVKIESDELIDIAYNRLLEECRRDNGKIMQAIQRVASNILPQDNSVEELRQVAEGMIRPSASDIEVLYNELKENAFRKYLKNGVDDMPDIIEIRKCDIDERFS